MKACTCPRCVFFSFAATDLLAMGDIAGALLAASEVTIVNDDGSIYLAPGEIVPRTSEVSEGYADLWHVDEDRPYDETAN